MSAVPGRRLPVPERFDLAGTAAALALVPGDPTVAVAADRVCWATRTPAGPGSLVLARSADGLLATGYGPGADWLVERADAVAGLRDDLGDFPAMAGRHPVVARLARAHAGLRLPASGRVVHHLVPAILGQKVTRQEATGGYLGLCRRLSEPAPGPVPGLRLPPDPARLAEQPYWFFHPLGIEQRRAETIRRAAGQAARLDAAPDPATATRLLTSVPGIGPWTAAEVVRVAYGDPDAVSVGDYHLPSIVASALAGQARADDARMLELLEPFAGQRARVCRLLALGSRGAARFGPRRPPRSFARM